MKAVPVNRYLIFLLIVAAGLAADLVSKSLVFSWLWPQTGRVIWLVEDFVGLEISLNEGALFGIGRGLVALFVAISIVAAVGIACWLFVAGAARELWLTVALASISTGIFGNLHDRLGLHGLAWPPGFEQFGHQAGEPVYAVRDWILLCYGDLFKWPNFNIADSMLVCGAIMLAIHAFRAETTGAKTPPAEGETE